MLRRHGKVLSNLSSKKLLPGTFAVACHLIGDICGRASGHARRFSSAPDHAFVITCKHLDARVALPLHGPIEDALQNRQPEGVGIGVLDGRGSIPTPGFESAGFKDLFDRMIHPYVINQFIVEGWRLKESFLQTETNGHCRGGWVG